MEAGAQRRSEIDTVIIDALTAVAPDVDPNALDPAQPFRDQTEIDSVDFLNFVLNIERCLGIRVPELEPFRAA